MYILNRIVFGSWILNLDPVNFQNQKSTNLMLALKTQQTKKIIMLGKTGKFIYLQKYRKMAIGITFHINNNN